MTDHLLKLRPLALLLVLIGFAVSVLTSLIGLIAFGVQYGFLDAMSSYGSSMLRSIFPLVLAVLLLLATLVKPEVANVRLLALVSLILTGVSLGLGALFSLIGIFAGHIGDGLLTFLSSVAVGTIGVVAFFVILRVFAAQPKPVATQSAYGQAGPIGPGGVPGAYGQQGQPGHPQGQGGPISVGQWGPQNAPQQGQQPVWQPDQAAGASWGSAQDAASGGAGTWGGQGQSGWQPQQSQPQQSQPQQSQPQQSQPQQSQPQQSQPQQGWTPQQQGYPHHQPSAGFPQHQPSAGYPQHQPSAGYPQSQPSAGYAAPTEALPAQTQPAPQASAWDDEEDDRTRLTPRVEVQPVQPQDPPAAEQPPQWGQPPRP